MTELDTKPRMSFPTVIWHNLLGLRTTVLNFRKHAGESEEMGFEYVATEKI